MRQMELPFLVPQNKRALPGDAPRQAISKRAKIDEGGAQEIINLEQENGCEDKTKNKSLDIDLDKESDEEQSQMFGTSATSTQLSEIEEVPATEKVSTHKIMKNKSPLKKDEPKKKTESSGHKITKEERHKRKLQKDEEAKKRRVKREKEAEERRAKKQKEALERKAKREKENEERRLRKEKEAEEKKIRREKVAEERRLKKERREKEKEERKLKFEEERRKKKEELEKKNKLKEEEKRKKEEEKLRKQQIEEEKRKKQSITNFFHVKATKNSTKLSRTSLPEAQKEDGENEGKSDFEKFFLPFYVKGNTRLVKHEIDLTKEASLEQFIRNAENDENTCKSRTDLNQYFSILANKELKNASEIKLDYRKAGDVAQKMNLGLIKDSQEDFEKVPRAFLQFYENMKVPYCGTFSYTIFDVKETLATNPFIKITSKQGPTINYEYDSDLEESDDEGDGEDIDLENDDEDDEDDEEDISSVSDIEGFVEKDGSDSQNSTDSKQKILGPLKPETRWLGQTFSEKDAFGKYFQGIKVKKVQAQLSFPINPFKNYWDGSKKYESEDNSSQSKSLPIGTDTHTERSLDTNNTQPGIMKVRKKTLTKEEDVKKLVDFVRKNSNYTLGTLTELLQKQIFTECSRSIVRNSIKHFASFDKKQNRWVINADATSTMTN